jgi:hypothetical protein
VPVAAWVASSFMRMSFSSMTPKAPSAVWIMEMASLALRTPWLSEAMSARMSSRTANPAASSAAVPTRNPEERRLVDTPRLEYDWERFRDAFMAMRLWLITSDILRLIWLSVRPRLALAVRAHQCPERATVLIAYRIFQELL